MKKGDQKRAFDVLAFHFWDFKLVPIDSALSFVLGNSYFSKMALYQEKQPNLNIKSNLF